MLRAALVAALLLAAAATAAASGGRPAVALADRDPVVVRGLRFEAGERVTVRFVIRGGERQTKLVRAGRTGAFRTAFPALAVGDCDVYSVQALGWRGSRAHVTHLPPPCGPAP